MKLCIDCRFYRRDPLSLEQVRFAECSSPHLDHSPIDNSVIRVNAHDERTIGKCGIGATFFEPKPDVTISSHTPEELFQRLFNWIKK